MGIKNPYHSTHVKHTITLATPRESVPESLLPTEKPLDPQISYVIGEEDLSVISPPFHQNTWLMHFYVATYQTSGSEKVVNVEVYRNGSLWQSKSSTNNSGNYLCHSFRKNGVAVGDVIEAYVWESTGVTNLYAHGISITPSQLCPQKNKTMLNFKTNNSSAVPIFSANGKAAITVNRYNIKYVRAETEGTTLDIDSPSWESEDGDFILRQQYGDNLGGDWVQVMNSATTVYMYGNRIPLNIEYEVLHD